MCTIMSSDGSFLVCYTGQLEFVDLTAAAGSAWHCKYEIIAGTDWKVINGLESAVSQTANVVVNGDKIVFNLPIDVTYKSSNPLGWPQFVISVYSGRTLQGYGRVHVPFQPGLHNFTIPLSKPAPTTYLGYFASFFGYQPELAQPSLLASGEANHLIKMISNGHASLSMNVLIKGLHDMGYDVGTLNEKARSQDLYK